MHELDLAAYTITVTDSENGLMGEVAELPGCVVVARTSSELLSAIAQAIYLHLDEHPEAPAYYLPATSGH